MELIDNTSTALSSNIDQQIENAPLWSQIEASWQLRKWLRDYSEQSKAIKLATMQTSDRSSTPLQYNIVFCLTTLAGQLSKQVTAKVVLPPSGKPNMWANNNLLGLFLYPHLSGVCATILHNSEFNDN